MAVPLLAAWFLVPCLAIALVVGPQSHSEGEQASFFTSIVLLLNFPGMVCSARPFDSAYGRIE